MAPGSSEREACEKENCVEIVSADAEGREEDEYDYSYGYDDESLNEVSDNNNEEWRYLPMTTTYKNKHQQLFAFLRNKDKIHLCIYVFTWFENYSKFRIWIF